MNTFATKTRSEQRIEQLVSMDRELSHDESDELYRALHADYMRKWRADRAKKLIARVGESVLELELLRAEAAMPERYPRR